MSHEPKPQIDPPLVMTYGESAIVLSTEHLRELRRRLIRLTAAFLLVLSVFFPGSVFSRLIEILPHAWK